MMPLNTLKNAEFGRGRAKHHAGITSSLLRLSAFSAAFHKQTHTLANLHISFFVFSASFRVFCGPLHEMMPLKMPKNAEV